MRANGLAIPHPRFAGDADVIPPGGVTAILHAQSWPPPSRVAALHEALHATCPGPRIVLGHEAGPIALGAARLINDAAAMATGSVLLVLEPSVDWHPDDLRLLARSAGDGLALAALTGDRPEADAPTTEPRRSSAARAEHAAVAEIERAVADALGLAAGAVVCGAARAPCGWAASLDTFRRLGGLSADLWLHGTLEEFGARVEAEGGRVQRVALESPWRGPESYPFHPVLARFFAWRHALRVAFAAHASEDAAVQMAVTASAAMASAWEASGLARAPLRFGSNWRPSLSDPVGALVPLLALDAFAADLPALAARRQRATLLPPASPRTAAPSAPAPAPAATPAVVAWPDRAGDFPVTSVIVVNWNGAEHLDACFTSIEASDVPADRLDIICVDNGSTDGSTELVARRFPRVKVVPLPANVGFTGGNREGVAVARGDVLVFLNNDMRVEPSTIRRLVERLSPDTPCVAARVLSWNGRAIDFVRGTLNFEGRGFQEHYGEPNRPELTPSTSTFFPNGGAFATPRALYLAAGGFDPDFFAYYDDVDLGWRLRLLGADIRVVADAVVYHRHGATSRKHPRGHKRFLMDRNALWTVFKNYGTLTLRRVLGPTLLLAVVRLMQDVSVRGRSPALRALAAFSPRIGGRDEPGPLVRDLYVTGTVDASGADAIDVRGLSLEAFAALGGGVAGFVAMMPARQAIQRVRRVDDRDVVPHLGRTFEYASSRSSYLDIQNALVEGLDLLEALRGTPHVLVITHEPLRRNLSGPGIRALEMARALSIDARVTVATPAPPEIEVPECTLAPYAYESPDTLRRLAEQADVLVVMGFTLAQFPFLEALDTPIVVDLYCPFTLEHLEMTTSAPDRDLAAIAGEAHGILGVQNGLLQSGDFFICASERQRDFWVGGLHAAGRINAHTYGRDSTLRHLVDVVPFGLPDTPIDEDASRTGPVLKGVHPGIHVGDRLLLWAGSMLDWQDPELLVRAVASVAARRDNVRLFFMGTRHPNPQVTPARVVERSRTLARELGVLDRHVFFNDWVPYERRAAYLREADLGLSTHTNHLETRYAFRTRMLDYIWAGVPIVCTDGDVFADLVRERRLGLTVPPGSRDALADALATLLSDADFAQQCRIHLTALADELRWSRVVEPLRAFVRHPRFAADRDLTVRRVRAELARSFKLTKWAKRTALSLGVGEAAIERAKQTTAVRTLMGVRNRFARRQAERRAKRAP